MNPIDSSSIAGQVTDVPDPHLTTSPLALDVEEFRRLGYRAVDLAAAHLVQAQTGSVFTPMPTVARENLLGVPFPEVGSTPEAVLDDFESEILPYPMGNGHPRFFGWVNSPPSPIAVVADLLAAAMNPSCAGGNHAAIYLEHAVIRWLMELVGFPVDGSKGLLVSGGSMASLTCLAAARQWASAADGWDARADGMGGYGARLVLYVSSEGHTCIRKAAELLGLGASAMRTIPTGPDFRFDVAALREAIRHDRATGHRPLCVVASAGTVNTGAIDPFFALADLCQSEGLWLHVDGAYGAVGVMDPTVADRFAGLERADSLALDPHKWLNVPVECGCALVRRGSILRDTFSLVPPYLRTEDGKGFGGLPWFSEYGFQQSRGFRVLKLWMTLRQVGRAGIAVHVSRHNALARLLALLIDDSVDLERLAPVELSIVCFRYVPDGWSRDDGRLDDLNKRLMEAIQAGGEAFVSGTVLGGSFSLRACIIHYATTEQDLEALVEIVRKTGRHIIDQTQPR
jgi:glutamate/tyrosine decarboxylase-like PLP-dependent enzyme